MTDDPYAPTADEFIEAMQHAYPTETALIVTQIRNTKLAARLAELEAQATPDDTEAE